MSYDDRFKDAAWYVKSKEEVILIVGAGGIGSNALYCLVKTIPATYWVIDDDTVAEYNVGCQFFGREDIGKYKVEALQNYFLKRVNKSLRVIKETYANHATAIMIAAVDNMKTRKDMFERWKENESRELFIDGRLRANLYEVYAVTKGQEEDYEKTLFDDKDVDDGPCTFKQTAYFGMLIGARITHLLVNYLTNKYSLESICNVPFKVYEVGEPFVIETT